MHTFLSLSSLLPALLGGFLLLGLLHYLRSWPQRRELQLLTLGLPLVSLGLSIRSLYHLTSRVCFLHTPPWDYTLSLTLSLGVVLVALGGFSLGGVRLGFMAWLRVRSRAIASPKLQELADSLSERVGTIQPRILLCPFNQPLALTLGLWRPMVLLSTWMIEHLDDAELEAVLAHELGHVSRRDYLMNWLALVLRDAFCYLPPSWSAYRQFQYEKELACDDLAVRITGRPLALASALLKTWQQALEPSTFSLAQSLVDGNELIERRIERLLAAPGSSSGSSWLRLVAFGSGLAVLGLLIGVTANNGAAVLASLGCGPFSLLELFH